MKIYIINLPKDKERKSFQEKQLHSLNLAYEIVPAVSVHHLSKQLCQTHQNDWQRPLRPVEIACYYSHRHLWQKILDTNEVALILEDDALLSHLLPKILDELSTLKEIDYINLEVVGRKKIVSKNPHLRLQSEATLYRLYLDRNGTGGYILYPSGARKLLALEEKIGIGLSDAHINSCYHLLAYQIEPAMVVQLDQCHQYGITPPMKGVSNIGIQKKPPIENNQKWYFIRKRIQAQLRQGFQHILYFFQSKKREITLCIEDFTFSMKEEQDA